MSTQIVSAMYVQELHENLLIEPPVVVLEIQGEVFEDRVNSIGLLMCNAALGQNPSIPRGDRYDIMRDVDVKVAALTEVHDTEGLSAYLSREFKKYGHTLISELQSTQVELAEAAHEEVLLAA